MRRSRTSPNTLFFVARQPSSLLRLGLSRGHSFAPVHLDIRLAVQSAFVILWKVTLFTKYARRGMVIGPGNTCQLMSRDVAPWGRKDGAD